MKNPARFFLLALSLHALPALGNPGPALLTLDEARRRALTQNYEVRAARHLVAETEAALGRARSVYWPRLGVAGGVENGTNGIQQTVGFGYLYGTVNLFRGMEDRFQVAVASLELDWARTRLQKTEFRIGLEVEKPFYQYLYLQKALLLRKEALTVNETHKTLARKRKSVSLVSETDVMEYDLRDALLHSDIASLEQERLAARLELQNALGSDNFLTEEPNGVLTHWHLQGSLPELLKMAEQESEAVLLARKDAAIAEVNSRRWQSKWWPEVDAEVQAGYLGLDNRPALGGSSLRGLILAKWELFSGFESVNSRREGEARRLRVEAEAKGISLATRTALSAHYRKLRSIEVRVHLEQSNQVRAKRYYDSVLREYRTGVRNSADVRQAAEGLYEASLRQERFKFDFVFERIDLEKKLGRPVAVETQVGSKPHPEIDADYLPDPPVDPREP